MINLMNTTIFHNSNGFVGLKYNSNGLEFHLPYGLNLSTNSNFKTFSRSMISLLNAIRHSKSTQRNIFKTNTNLGAHKNFPVFDILWLIKDYLSNGIYQQLEKDIRANTNGKINWKKTLQGDTTFSPNGLFYDKLIVNKSKFSDSIYAEIHRHCISIAGNTFKWLFNNLQIPITTIKLTNNEMISLLMKKVNNSFDDRTRQLMIAMINILNLSSSMKSTNIVYEYGVESFDFVWEQIINVVYCNCDVSKYSPNATYLIFGNSFPAKSKLRPDTILLNNDVYVIDSKYYKYGITLDCNDLPGSSDVNKQIAYAENIDTNVSSQKNDRMVYNMFLIPYYKDSKLSIEKGVSGDICYLGYAEGSWRPHTNKKWFDYISIILVDMQYALKNYSIGYNDNAVQLLIQESNRVRINP